MTLGDPRPFDPEHLKKWWEVTCKYLMADSMSEPSAADLLGAADAAMYQVKNSGRNNVARFESSPS